MNELGSLQSAMVCVSQDTTVGRRVPAGVRLSDVHPWEEVSDQLKTTDSLFEDCKKVVFSVLIAAVLGFCHHSRAAGLPGGGADSPLGLGVQHAVRFKAVPSTRSPECQQAASSSRRLLCGWPRPTREKAPLGSWRMRQPL